jgi:hypothetical protein
MSQENKNDVEPTDDVVSDNCQQVDRLPALREHVPRIEVPNRFLQAAREANRFERIIDEHTKLSRHLDLLEGSAAATAISEFQKSHAFQISKITDALKLPESSALDSIIQGFHAQYEKQLVSVDRLAARYNAISHLETLRDGLATKYAQGWLSKDYAKYFATLDQSASASIVTAASVRLNRPEYRAFADLRSALGANKDLASLIQSVRAPWAKLDDLVGSAVGVAETSTLFAAVHRLRPFDERVTDFLRFELGDYRDDITWDEERARDPDLRLKFYTEQGLRVELRDTPGNVLSECEAQVAQPQAVTTVLTPFSFRMLVITEGDERNVAAYRAIRELEKKLRAVISSEMTRVYGKNWIKSNLKPHMRDSWIEKQERAVQQGRPKDPLIEYADFTDYEQIITGNAAWEAIFKPLFGRKEDIKESFQRLGPSRVALSHARDVLEMDLLLIALEGSRLMKGLDFVKH